MFQCVCFNSLPDWRSISLTDLPRPAPYLCLNSRRVAALALLAAMQPALAQSVKIDPVYQSGFESGATSLEPLFNVILEGSLNATTEPQPLVLHVSAPVPNNTFVPITSSEPARLEVAGGGVTITSGQSSAVVMVNAYQAGAIPVVLIAKLGNTVTAGVRVEKVLNETNLPGELDYCETTFPPFLSVAAGATTVALYGRVFETGVTAFAGPPGGWLVGVGYGPAGSDPRQLADWQFKAANWNLQVGNDDEYASSLVAPSASGVYTYAFRMSQDGGGSWTYCDLDGAGSNLGSDFSPAQLPKMYVFGADVRNETDLPAEADFCILQFPASIDVFTGATTATVYGRLFESGATEAAGAPPGWTAQAGFGPLDSDPRVPFDWTFFNAAFNLQDGNNDEFAIAMQAPIAPGQYAYVFRFSQDAGATWTYCDLDGSGANPGLVFNPSQLPVMTVQTPPP